MADSIKIGNLDISSFKVGSDDCKVYLGDTLLYPTTPPSPSGSCYEVISTPISSYSSTTYDSVFSWDDNKWYMKNNLDDYEEYGVYDIVYDISEATTYDGKLAVVDTTEYQYSGDSWVEVGTYESEETTFEINEWDEYQYQGVELSTTFKIPYSDVEDLGGYVSFTIYTQDNGELHVDTGDYRYTDEERNDEYGNVTDDGDYYYFSLPDTQSITIDRIEYYDWVTIHIIAGTKQVSVEYPDKDIPLGKVYSSVASMESDSCPTVGIGQCGIVGNNVYKFSNNEEWDAVNSFKFAGVYGGEIVYAIDCDSSSAVTQSETKPSYISSAITSAIIGDCATSIDDYTFQQCTSLTSVDISDSVTSIGNGAFQNCFILSSCTIPSGVTSIGNSAFNNCRILTGITIPSSVTSIGQYAFANCYGFTNINIPDSLASIGRQTFYQCTSVTSITVDNNNAYYSSEDGVLFNKTKTDLIQYPIGNSGTAYSIPNSVTSIGVGVFAYSTNLSSVSIPDSVTSIGDSAFMSCSSITSITIPSGVTSIGWAAFYDCSGLTSITVNATTPPTLDSSVFDGSSCQIYVPSGSVDVYKAATNWSTYANRIQAIP